ncbi:MAG TPA: carbamoyl-phosphate synthase large subunit [Chloroflexi bacterium]|jgi:carbamoyl-phosphate synthase large subunit|nr:carbamoyl-phosphate synthase large subunit [Chloroflexota bacterium]
MPKRTDLHSILIIGSGPIVIGQACEFDYSGTQACKALREEGYRTILVNSNPATIMTDPQMADATYIEPLSVPFLERIIARERPDAILPTMGGQTGLNLGMDLYRQGVLERYSVELIGARGPSIEIAEDRELFKQAIADIGLEVPRSHIVHSLDEARSILDAVGLPAILRPSFTLGGSGSGIAYNRQDYERLVAHGLDQSPVHQVLVEESVIGWKEIELEVMRDSDGNFIVVCSIENLDAMGVHTGDSITVAPAQTLSARELQALRDMAQRIMERVGVEAGGSNVQFAMHPKTGRVVVIEMNPRVSRSSALASKATGFPIAKVSTKLAVGYRLHELPNDITRETPASFEPAIDYVVVKVPRWNLEKFPQAETTLGTQMKSVGEVMAIGRTFNEALQKALCAREDGRDGIFDPATDGATHEEIMHRLLVPNPERIHYLPAAMDAGMSLDEIHEATSIDHWFLREIDALRGLRDCIAGRPLHAIDADLMREAKRAGMTDAYLARILSPAVSELDVRAYRKGLGICAVYSRVDTCAAEFPSCTAYLYSNYESLCEAEPSARRKVMVLGSGPNRIGQGIEFDYCCVHASMAFQDLGYETIMVNCNPETVSTDYDVSDRLYFEPLTLEHILNIYDIEQPKGVIVQFGGQTPLKLVRRLADAGVPILGTSPDGIDLAEDRERFGALMQQIGLPMPKHGIAHSAEEAFTVADDIGYPVIVRPSYVLGGRAMAIVYDRNQLDQYIRSAVQVAEDTPILIDRFLEDAFEMDVDCVCDGKDVRIAAIMEQIELTGVHSGDSACVIPTVMVDDEALVTLHDYTRRLACALHTVGCLNVQYAMKDGVVYVIEANPRASRTVPYVSKATGVPWARIACQLVEGHTLDELDVPNAPRLCGHFVKEVVLPFVKFPGEPAMLGPEMRSTGEVMGVDESFGMAFAKAQIAAGNALPTEGTVFLSVNDRDKQNLLPIARKLAAQGFSLIATRGTAAALRAAGLDVRTILKVSEGRPNGVDHIINGDIHLVINTPLGSRSFSDEHVLRQVAIAHGVPVLTTLSAAKAATLAIAAVNEGRLEVRSLQEHWSTRAVG